MSELEIIGEIISDMINDIVGGIENCISDEGKEEAINLLGELPTREDVKNDIYDELINGKSKYVTSPIRRITIERKHIRFQTKEVIQFLIDQLVEQSYNNDKWSWL